MSVALLRDLASSPRPTGSDAIAAARARCARELRDLGYTVRERSFEFSAFVGRFAFPLFGGLTAAVAATSTALGRNGLRMAPLVVIVGAMIALFLAARLLLTRGVLSLPIQRARAINLEAFIEGDDPGIWLCAHVDSKSQPVSTLVRTIGIAFEGFGFLAIAALSVASLVGASTWPLLWDVGLLVTLAGAVPVVLCVVGTNSPGALDNASGVATVVAAAREMRGQRGVGVLITDAEELALAGARAWSRDRTAGPTTVLNCDGVDDDGAIYVMFAGERPDRLMGIVEHASRTACIVHRQRRLGFGIVTDSLAFTDAGIASITFSRGSVASLARVHGPRDDLAHLRGVGIAETATLMAATARRLMETENR